MGEPTYPLIRAIRERLIASEDVTAAVPADNILDWTTAPTRSPMIMMGEGQAVFNDFHAAVHIDLHIWCREDGTRVAKQIAGPVIDTIEDDRFVISGLFVSDLRISASRYMRDPGGKYSHGVISLAAIVQERAA